MPRSRSARQAKDPRPLDPDGSVLVVGLGRFGGALAESLMGMGHEVLGIDADARIVQSFSTKLTHVAEADSTNVDALRQLGCQEFTHAVVGIGTDIENSILTTAALVDLEVKNIWAKAISDAHGTILGRVGAHRVVYPEKNMGERVAHLVTGRMLEFIQIDPNFALVETGPPREAIGKTLGEAGIRARYGVTVVCIKPAGQNFTYAEANSCIKEDDILLVAGETKRAEHFAERSERPSGQPVAAPGA